jgi:recombination protein RecR
MPDLLGRPQGRITICVVERPRDLAALERAGTYRGLYHVLHGRLAPLDKAGAEQLTIDRLAQRVRHGGIQEIIMATNPTLEETAPPCSSPTCSP